MKTASQVVREIRVIQRDRGPGYFIRPGRRSSRSVTGGRDFWRFVYTIVVGDGIFDGGITSQRALKDSYEEAIERHGEAVLVEVSAEHVACSCHSHRSVKPDIHCHEDTLGTVAAA